MKAVRAAGLFIVICGILINPFSVGALLSPDGVIEDPLTITFILLFELILLACALFFLRAPHIVIRYRKEIALMLFVGVALFLVLESVARFIWKEPLGGTPGRYGYPAGLHRAHEDLGYAYVPGFTGTFPYPPFNDIAIRINAKGLRDVPHTYEKPEGIIRILGLGDSVTFGAGTSLDDTYLAQLERTYERDGANVEVIKAGVNRYAFDQKRIFYAVEGYTYDPDVVLVGIVLDDARETDIAAEQERVHVYAANAFHYSLKNLCRVCDVLFSSIRQPPARQEEERTEHNRAYAERVIKGEWDENWEYFTNELLAFQKHTQENGATLALMLFPYTEQFEHSENLTREPQERIAAFARAHDIPYIDLLPIMDRPDYEAFYLPGDHVHLNAAGNARIAEALTTFLNPLLTLEEDVDERSDR